MHNDSDLQINNSEKGTTMIFQRLRAIFLLGLTLSCATSFALEEGDTIPEFNLASIYEGQPNIQLSNLEGKTLYIDFWASWCIAINVDNPIEDGLDFLLDTPLDFLIPQDPEGDAAELFGVIGMPSSYLVSPDGNVELVHMGFRNGDINVIEEEIKKVLQEN